MLLVVLGTLVGDLLLFRHTSKAAVVPRQYAVEPKVDGTVYVGSADHNVYALNARAGTKVWSFSTPDYVDSFPSGRGWYRLRRFECRWSICTQSQNGRPGLVVSDRRKFRLSLHQR